MKKNNKPQELSINEEMLMWTSYRYCIGRKTYVNSLAPYIGQKYYKLLSDACAEHTAIDIRERIGDCLRFGHPGFYYEGTVSRDERNHLADYLTWITDNVNSKEDLYNIEKIVCYKDGYGDKYEKKFDVVRKEREWTHIYESDFSDLLVWEELASLMDKKNHKIAVIKFNDKVEELEVFPVWRKICVPMENEPGYYKEVKWKYERCWKSVDNYLKNGEHSGSLNEDYILEIK